LSDNAHQTPPAIALFDMPLDLPRLSRQPAYRSVTDHLSQRIVAGDIALGDALPTETELAERFGVHRTTVREGLRLLEQDGLVQRQGKRLIVCAPSPSNAARSGERALRLQQVSLLDVFQVALALEPICAQVAASQATAADIGGLDDNLARTEAIVARGDSPVDVDLEFQSLVAQATHNAALLLARAPISRLMHLGYAIAAPALPQSGTRLLQAHRHIADAIASRDAAAAEHWMRRHMLDYRRGCEAAGLDMRAPLPDGQPAHTV